MPRPWHKEYPAFRPNLTPRQIFRLGSFGGTYWRPIRSAVTGKNHRGHHRKFGAWWKGIPDSRLTSPVCDITVNKYRVRVGTSLPYWESKGWIHKRDPYGWVQWYCEFYAGRRTSDDERQIRRWERLAGPNGRFRRQLISLIRKKRGKWDDAYISPKIRQTLQHWGYRLTRADYEAPKPRAQKTGSAARLKAARKKAPGYVASGRLFHVLQHRAVQVNPA